MGEAKRNRERRRIVQAAEERAAKRELEFGVSCNGTEVCGICGGGGQHLRGEGGWTECGLCDGTGECRCIYYGSCVSPDPRSAIDHLSLLED